MLELVKNFTGNNSLELFVSLLIVDIVCVLLVLVSKPLGILDRTYKEKIMNKPFLGIVLTILFGPISLALTCIVYIIGILIDFFTRLVKGEKTKKNSNNHSSHDDDLEEGYIGDLIKSVKREVSNCRPSWYYGWADVTNLNVSASQASYTIIITAEVAYTTKTAVTYENADNVKTNLNECNQKFADDLLEAAKKAVGSYVSTHSKIHDSWYINVKSVKPTLKVK